MTTDHHAPHEHTCAGHDVARRPARARVASGIAALVCALSLASLVVVGALTSFTLIPALFGWQPEVILSGSMEPSISAGDVVVAAPVAPDQIFPGRVLLVNNPNRPGEMLVHRVVSVNADGSIITRGDANNVADSTPVPPQDVRGMPRLRVPMVGLPALWIHDSDWLRLAGGLTGLLLMLWGATGIRRSQAPHDAGTPVAASAA